MSPIPLPPAIVLPDPEEVAVRWAKSDPDLAALTTPAGDPEPHISTLIPEGATSPWLRVIRIPGGSIDTEAPIDHAMLQWDCFAWRDQGSPDFIGASLLGRTLVAKARVFAGKILESYIYGFTITAGPERMPADERTWARYRVDTQISLRRG